MTIKSVCVFCGARETVAEKYKQLARQCGILLAKHDLTLVYGAGRTGLMGAVSDGAFRNGAKVIGVYPKTIEGKEPLNDHVTELFIVNDMSIRKNMMIDKSDAFFILPGGMGTLDEAFEIITLSALGAMNKPIIWINYEGFWDEIRVMINKVADEGFARPNLFDCFTFVTNLEEAFKKIGYE